MYNTEIVSKYVDHHCDYITFYIRKHENNYTITDGSYTISDLEISGFDNVLEIIKPFYKKYKIKRIDDTLFIESDEANLLKNQDRFESFLHEIYKSI